ncbi:MAG: hypothetical protein KDD73_08390 [Anaerolineales bacterium]|nr:hypothetical protein [Anaerolineales bacterium]MCB9126450.1 hypothetical protein [Ardenticatenales bacterium]MCB9171610.1 hypothetical protein [Ardenticatenales bacterium]
MTSFKVLDDASMSDEAIVAAGLEARTVPQMRQVAARFDWPLSGLRRDGLIEQMTGYYLDEAQIARALDTLTAEERQTLSLIVWSANQSVAATASAAEAMRPLLRSGPRAPIVPTTVQGLVEMGLLFRINTPSNSHIVVTLSSITDRLLPIEGLLETMRPTAQMTRYRAKDPLSQLLQVVNFLIQQEGKLVKRQLPAGADRIDPTGWPTGGQAGQTVSYHSMVPIFPFTSWLDSRPLLALRSSLGAADKAETNFYLALAFLLFGDQSSFHLQIDESRFHDFLRLPLAEQQLRLYEAWLGMGHLIWDELSWLQSRSSDFIMLRQMRWGWGTLTPATFSAALAEARAALFVIWRWLLAEGHDGRAWLSVESLLQLLRATRPLLLGTTRPPQGQWYIADARGTAYEHKSYRLWRKGAGRAFAYMLRGPMRWLGYVDCLHDSQGELVAVRPVAGALSLFKGEISVLDREEALPLTWEGLRVTVPTSASTRPLLSLLSEVAQLDHVEGNAICFEFTLAAAARAFANHLTPEAIRDRFAARAVTLPSAVSQALDRWKQGWGKAHRYDEFALMEVEGELLVRELGIGTQLNDYIAYRLSPTTFAVLADRVAELVSHLEAKGYHPRQL